MAGEAENVEIVRALYDAVNRAGSWVAGADVVDPEIEIETDPRHPQAGVYRGIERYRAFLEEFEEAYERTTVVPERIYAHGDQVLTVVSVHRRPRGSSIEVESRVAFLWTVRDGRLVREQAFAEPDRALAETGFGESDAVEVTT